jgi:hypothetical protein
MLNLRPQQELNSSHVEVFEWILLRKNIKLIQLTKGHNWSPCEFQLSVGKFHYQRLQNVVNEEPQHLFYVNSEYLCVESISWITMYVREWLTTKYEYFLLQLLLKKQLSIMLKSLVFNFIKRYGRIKCCKVIGFDTLSLMEKMVILSFLVVLLNFWESTFG